MHPRLPRLYFVYVYTLQMKNKLYNPARIALNTSSYTIKTPLLHWLSVEHHSLVDLFLSLDTKIG